MTTLEIVLTCIIIWLVGIVVILWLAYIDMWQTVGLEDYLIFIWFITIPIIKPIYNIHRALKRRKVPYNVKCGYDEDHACVLKLPFGWEKFIIYKNLYINGHFEEKENFTEQDVANVLKEYYEYSDRKIKYLRKTKQLTKVTNKIKELYK